ncbi:MAG: hypothetical protein IJ153_10950 [Clostridia bacterium]|nr:hypothetical protein [Clostridia bacterium]MBQ9212204.1 hypothetical protein [Clostridia bacterium]
MPGKVIGDKLPIGYAGTPSRMSDCVIDPHRYDVANKADGNIQFGAPLLLDTTNGGIRKFKSTDTAATGFIGVAVRRMGQPKADAADGWYYAPGEVVDVLLRGAIVVEFEDVTGIVQGGAVYVNPATGKFSTVSTNNLLISNAKIATGRTDTDKLVEIVLITRAL